MSSIIISGDTSGSITLKSPDISGTNTITLPAATGTAALTSQVIGVGQTWQNVLPSRANNTNYTNSTGRPIMVNISVNDAGAVSSTAYVDGLAIAQNYGVSVGGYSGSCLSFIVPAGGVYKVVLGSGSGIQFWVELR